MKTLCCCSFIHASKKQPNNSSKGSLYTGHVTEKVGMDGYTRVYRGMHKYTWVYRVIHGYTRVYKGLQGYTRVYRGIQG